MKKALKFFVLPMLMICSLFTLVACGGNTTPDGISLHSEFKTEYYLGETLDTAGGILDYTKDGQTTHVAITPLMVSSFSTETVGTREMVVTYTDVTIEKTYTLLVSYTVTEDPNKLVDGIVIRTAFKTDYYIGESLDITGGMLNYTKEGVTTPVAIEESMISGFATDVTGAREMVISYGDYTITVSYSVRDTIFELNTAYRSTDLVSNTGNDGQSENYLYVWFVGDNTMAMQWSVEVPEAIGQGSIAVENRRSYTSKIVDGRLVVETEAQYGGKYVITKITSDGFELAMVMVNPDTQEVGETFATYTMVKIK